MDDRAYHELREVLDAIPNGFPSTKSGVEIKLLKKIFTPEEARITTQLTLHYETADMIAERMGTDKNALKAKLLEMRDKGQIFGAVIGETALFKMMPFVFGIYEMQLNRLDDEFITMMEQYWYEAFGKHFHSVGPSILKVLPIEKDLPAGTEIAPYESLTKIIEGAKAWAVGDCICKKERAMKGHRCDRPMEVCMAFAPIENYFEGFFWGRPITKDEAFSILNKAEEAGLVHMVTNVQEGQYYVCNCCSCCCGMLKGILEFGFNNAVGKSRFVAAVDESRCSSCSVCVDRCQVNAISIDNAATINERCIGCGLCVGSCPSGAIRMQEREAKEIEYVPKNEREWYRLRAEARGMDERYKKLL